MTTEQQRKILEFAAKACGVELEPFIAGKKPCRLIEGESGEGYISVLWNPSRKILENLLPEHVITW